MVGPLPCHGRLLGEVKVTYDSNVPSGLPTKAGVQELHITSGVAVALVIWQGTYTVKDSPVSKNARQQWGFRDKRVIKSNNIYPEVVMSWAAEYMCFLDDHGEMRWQLCLQARAA